MFRTKTVIALIILSVFILAGGIFTMISSQATPAAQAQQPTLDLTVYNSNIGLVKEIRQFDLKTGVNQVAVTDVPSSIIPESVHFRSLDDAKAYVLEQNYEYDIVGSQKLLQKYIDQPIVVITQDGSKHEGVLLSGANDIILQSEDGGVDVLNYEQVRQFSFPALPEGLITKPTLKWLVDASKAGKQDVELAYLTNNITWESNYVIAVAKDSSKLDLDGWITLDNRSGASYQDARLKLVAGEVNRVSPAPEPQRDYMVMEAKGAGGPPQVAQRAFGEYHLYEIPRPVTIKDNQTKQIQFISAHDVPAQKIYVFDSWTAQPLRGGNDNTASVSVKLRFNTGEEGVNAQLPAGVVRMYQPDEDGSPLFIGEDRIDHTPKDEDVTLTIGQAFDLVGERSQTDMKRLSDKVWQESYKITLRNHKENDAVEIHVVEHLNNGLNWEIIKTSAEDFTKLDSNTVEWVVSVPAKGDAAITYTVQYNQ